MWETIGEQRTNQQDAVTIGDHSACYQKCEKFPKKEDKPTTRKTTNSGAENKQKEKIATERTKTPNEQEIQATMTEVKMHLLNWQ